MQNGTIECGHTSPYYYFGKDRTFTFGTDLPFGMNVRMRNAWLYHGGGLDLLRSVSEGGCNTLFLPAGNTNCQMGGWFATRLVSQSLKRFEFRVGGSGLTSTAGRAVSRSRAAHYTALEKGTIDAAEWSVRIIRETRFREGRQILLLPGLVEDRADGRDFVNLQEWNELPNYTKYPSLPLPKPINGCPEIRRQNPVALSGLQPRAPSQAFPQDVMQRVGRQPTCIGKVFAKNALFKRVYDHFVAFRNDQYL